ncbi:MAG: VWA domain-containing protein [Kofleriaceae bacterium]|nr:VWA domain-containing protein [Kofleriaceae bacterium]
MKKGQLLATVGIVIAGAASLSMQVFVSRARTTEARWERGTTGVLILAGVVMAIVGGLRWYRHRDERDVDAERHEPEDAAPRTKLTAESALRAALPWAITIGLGLVLLAVCSAVFDVPVSRMLHELRRVARLAVHPHSETPAMADAQNVVWKSPRAIFLVFGAGLVAIIGFHLHRRRTASFGFSQTKFVGTRGFASYVSALPTGLRVLALVALAIGLGRPETYRKTSRTIDSIDIVIVMDMSKSMEETDMPRDRMDAAQRVIRRFLRRNKNDRIGLVIFGQQAMLQCPLTHDSKMLEKIVQDLVIGDVPELGTAIGDGLALAVAQLRRSDAKSKVVILLSDGDSNWVTRFDPDEAARAAQTQKIKVYTLLVGREESDMFGGMSVNPATLRNIATQTGGEFFRASDYASFDRGFQTVRNQLDTTKRTIIERVPDKQLFVPFAVIAALLVSVELLLSHTRLRRLP